MSEAFYAGAYWGPRPEPIDRCTGRLYTCLTRLAAIHPIFSTWFRKGGSKEAALKEPMPLRLDNLNKLLLAGQNRRDVGGGVISELGFSASLWNGNTRIPSACATTCGALKTRGVTNHFVLDLPAADGEANEIYRADLAHRIIEGLVDSWTPDWATLTSHSMRNAQGPIGTGQPVVGWITYLAESTRIILDRLPPGVDVQKMNGGVLLTIGSAPPVPQSLLLGVRQSFSGEMAPY